MQTIKLAFSWFKRTVLKKTLPDYVRKGHHTLVTGILSHSPSIETWVGKNKKPMRMKIIWNTAVRYNEFIEDHFIESSWEFLGFEGEPLVKELKCSDYIKTMREFNEEINSDLKKLVDTRSMDSTYRKILRYGN